MQTPRLVAFDLDDTLAPSKTRMDPRMAKVLRELADRVEVAIISGGQWQQFQTQVIDQLPELSLEARGRLHLMPTCGTKYVRHNGTEFATVYAENLTDDERDRAKQALRTEALRLAMWELKPAGDVIEDRGSQITFSALGQQARLEDKHAWDPTGAKKAALRDAVARALPDLEVRSGGSTSIDITRKGIDKAFGMARLVEATGIALDEMLFFGDRLDEGGNDYPVLEMGVRSIAVEGWEDTLAKVAALVDQIDPVGKSAALAEGELIGDRG
ncbi:HAD-IIB family hydrolase [Microbacterium sp. NC79]|uniref:HAD-IIB family hydrolase n=1 Tax=Microbacterium sp. NC79 TaxID=2851009 RepID=UPI001C2C2296|nr:HAD-IIB family hydrolase [Microbacterium sp. NC79]MBV0894061.1 HAD-IIB family hydrolase [Microbacterium sp. NC79]